MELAETNERKKKICTLMAYALCYPTHSIPSHHTHTKPSMSQAVYRVEFSLSSDSNI
jgi:hypothetical protein